ncbi:MAG: transposase [Acidobacteriota bacterium]
MLDEYGFELYEENEFPLAYLLTFRTFGTWLHGDSRWSVGRSRRSPRESKLIQPNVPLNEKMADEMNQAPVILNKNQRDAVELAISEVCENRGYSLRAVNARTNHVHSVVTAQIKPERIINTFKAYSTRKLRDANLFPRDLRVWSCGRSRRYLWKPRNVLAAIDYVLYSQGWVPFEDWVVTWIPPEDDDDGV